MRDRDCAQRSLNDVALESAKLAVCGRQLRERLRPVTDTIKGRFWLVGLKKRFQFFLVKLPNKEAASFKSRLPLCPALQRALEAMRLLIAFERSLVQHKR